MKTHIETTSKAVFELWKKTYERLQAVPSIDLMELISHCQHTAADDCSDWVGKEIVATAAKWVMEERMRKGKKS